MAKTSKDRQLRLIQEPQLARNTAWRRTKHGNRVTIVDGLRFRSGVGALRSIDLARSCSAARELGEQPIANLAFSRRRFSHPAEPER